MATYSTLYVNSTSFATATAVFTDSTLSTLAADGYYSDGNIVRRQLNGVLQLAGNCGTCTPAAVACSGSVGGSGGQGIYLLTVDLGETVSDVGAVIIEFNVSAIPDGIRVTYDGTIYNTISSPNFGPLKGETDDFTFIGSSSSWCSPDPRNTTLTLNEYEHNGTSFVLTGGTQDIFIDPDSDETTASVPGTSIMVIPKPNQTPGEILIEMVGPCSSTYFSVDVNCPLDLSVSNSFSSSVVNVGEVDSGTNTGTGTTLTEAGQNFLSTVSVGDVVKNTTEDTYSTVSSVDSDTQLTLNDSIMNNGDTYSVRNKSGACGLSLTATYYNVDVSGSPGSPAVNDFVFSDVNGATKLSEGFYQITGSNYIYVDLYGVVKYSGSC